MRYSIIVLTVAVTARFVSSATIHVPADQRTIQAGIDAAVDGDTVLAADGVYTGEGNWDIDFDGKNIVLKSEGGSDVTIIDCDADGAEPHRGFLFINGEESGAVLDGFTIRNGETYSGGGGIYCFGSSPVIQNCRLAENAAVGVGPTIGVGGGIYCRDASPTIIRCSFIGNVAGETQGAGGGGGICCMNSSPVISNCIFISNQAVALGIGSALLCINSSPSITNCTFSENASSLGGATLYFESVLPPLLENCIIAFSPTDEAVVCSDALNPPLIICCDIYGNEGGDWSGCIADQAGINGNLSTDPLFCDIVGGDFHIEDTSPAAPTNNDCRILIGALGIGCGYLCGDANDDKIINVGDPVYIITYIFLGGPAPELICKADADGNTQINLADAVYLMNYIFKGGPPPVEDCCH